MVQQPNALYWQHTHKMLSSLQREKHGGGIVDNTVEIEIGVQLLSLESLFRTHQDMGHVAGTV
jgi:hypothetical protein